MRKKDIGIGIVAGIAVLALLMAIDSSIDGKSDSSKSSATSSSDSKQRWCPDALWVRSAPMLYQTTYASTSQTITAKNIYAGTEQGGSLNVNYNYQASIGQMPSDI
ncbi:hypothetical protein ACFWBS_12315 [Streptomyces mirabilis]|uniref:hypothetical protein n=1 Tax=Streptomyces mirabilis TaxID=68239 RepID=UPI0036569FF2